MDTSVSTAPVWYLGLILAHITFFFLGFLGFWLKRRCLPQAYKEDTEVLLEGDAMVNVMDRIEEMSDSDSLLS